MSVQASSPARRRLAINPHVLAIVENEWAQLIRNKIIVFTTLVPPIMLVALALGVLILSSWIDMAAVPTNQADSSLATSLSMNSALNAADTVRAALLSPFIIMFQVIPLVVPITIASYSIVGEKQTRSLEALLSTPVRTWELLLAKAFAAALPGVIATWYGFGTFALVARFVVSDALYRNIIFSPTWVLAIMVMTPLMTLLAVGLGIIISSRVKDPQSAQQLGSLVILPLVGLLVGQVTGMVVLEPTAVLFAIAGLAVLDAILLVVAVRIFGREEILTSWR